MATRKIQLKTARERFSAKWEAITETGCWLWTDSLCNGYGQFRLDDKMRRAHRVSWELHNGDIPEGLHVLHKCDTPACVNPSHLFLGTNADNMADKVKKGRNYRGERHWSTKLTEGQVLSIRGDDRANVAIAADYGVSNRLIQMIKARKRWAHLET